MKKFPVLLEVRGVIVMPGLLEYAEVEAVPTEAVM